VRIDGPEFSSIAFDAVADKHGMLFATTPSRVPCYTKPITVTVTDVGSGAQSSQARIRCATFVQSFQFRWWWLALHHRADRADYRRGRWTDSQGSPGHWLTAALS